MKTISLKLPEALDSKLSAAARRSKRTKSAVVREVLEDYLNGTAPAKKVSCYDLTADLCGIFDGPPDLSTNKNYMEGFGQ
ncbi:MAG: ribbon-helix-helix protein, CopG family [Pirellulales bacterium]|nr:ribbon-helix-helix protein, CopG family [Pirellulales bacterium]